MNFRALACENLSRYKAEVLGVMEDGLFHFRGQDIPKSHILPIAHLHDNILERYRSRFWSSEYSSIKLHRYFHHLNSSQALCINLLYPLIAENALGLFLQYLGIEHEAILRACFEKESEIEVATRRTSFDFWLQMAKAGSIFVEVKYTEDGFGKANPDDEHREKFRKTYRPLVEQSPFLNPECQEEAFFLSHYQVLRNLVHISDTDRVVFLFPAADTVVAKQAAYARDHLLNDAGRKRFSIVFLEDFVSMLEERCKGGSLDGYYQDFRAKYLPRVVAT